tara:strand:- start:6295 stop:8805 length:2511 start_codon:yes stop_codon:yes gene_type:complete
VANSDITLGAQLRAIGNAVGLSEDQVIQMVVGAQRKGGRKLGRELGTDEAQGAVLNRLKKVQGVNQDIPEQLKDDIVKGTVPNSVLQYGEFGNQDELQNFGGLDEQGRIKNAGEAQREIEKARGKRDSNVISRSFFEKGKEGVQREEVYVEDGMPVPARFVEAAKNRDFGIYQEGVMAPAPQVQRIGRDALQQRVDEYGAEAFGGVPDPQRGISVDIPGVVKNRSVDPLLAGVQGPNARGARLGEAYSAVTPSAVDVIGRIDDDIRGNPAAEQSLVREMVGQERDGLASSEIRRRADLQLNEEFSGNDTPGAAMRAMPMDAYKVREQQILNELGGIRPNPVMVAVHNIENQIEAERNLREGYPTGGLSSIGQIAKLGNAKYADDFTVSQNPVDRGTVIPDSLEINLPDQYNAPVTDNRFAGPLQRQEQWLYDAVQGEADPRRPDAYSPVGVNEQMGLARQAIQNAKIKGQSVDLGSAPIRNVAELQAAADQVLRLAEQQGAPFFNNVDGKNVFNSNPGIGEVLERGGMNARQVGDVARANFQVANAIRGEAVKLDRPVGYGGDHPDLGGGEARIAMLGREKIEGREVKAQLQKLDGKRGNPGEPLNAQELAEARMPFQGGIAGEGIKRAAFVRGADRGLSSDAIYEKYGAVNGQIANAVIQRAEQAQGSNPDGFGVRVERQRNMDPGPQFDPGPDPWSQPIGTGNGINQEITNRRSMSAQKALPYGIQTSGASQGPTRPLTTELRNELAALSSGYSEQGPRPASNYSDPGFTAEGTSVGPRRVRQEADYRQAVRNLGRVRGYGRNAAIAGGAAAGLAGLDSLFSGERNRREEEQYQ